MATISIERKIELTEGSTFTIQPNVLGIRHIEINLVDNQELINNEEIQSGNVQPPDTAEGRKLSKAERDSLVKYDPVYQLADTIMMILRMPSDTTKINN